jgi:hypothetical protein
MAMTPIGDASAGRGIETGKDADAAERLCPDRNGVGH